MKIDVKIKALKEEIKEKEYELRTIKEKAVLFSGPKGYSKGTSYEIHDCIHGSKRSIDIYKLAEEIERLEVLIDIDTFSNIHFHSSPPSFVIIVIL